MKDKIIIEDVGISIREQVKKVVSNETQKPVKKQKIESVFLNEDFRKLIQSLIARNKKEASTLEEISQMINTNSTDEARYKKLLSRYIYSIERSCLLSKNLHLYKNGWSKHEIDFLKIYGENDFFPYELEKVNDEHYFFVLPKMMSKQVKGNSDKSNLLLNYAIMNLIQKHKNEKRIKLIEKPVIVFEHFTSDKKYMPDTDNVDIKVAIDAIQNHIIKNDSLDEVTIYQTGKVCERDMTKMHIMTKKEFKIFITEQEED